MESKENKITSPLGIKLQFNNDGFQKKSIQELSVLQKVKVDLPPDTIDKMRKEFIQQITFQLPLCEPKSWKKTEPSLVKNIDEYDLYS